MTIQSEKEFDVLGYRLRYRPDATSDTTANMSAKVNADDVVDYLNQRADVLRSRYPHLDSGQVATLLALDIAKEKLVMEREIKISLHNLEERTERALSMIGNAEPLANNSIA